MRRSGRPHVYAGNLMHICIVLLRTIWLRELVRLRGGVRGGVFRGR